MVTAISIDHCNLIAITSAAITIAFSIRQIDLFVSFRLFFACPLFVDFDFFVCFFNGFQFFFVLADFVAH
ncbi:hypothetical protein D3C87_1735380 [compost metagenome]